MGNLKTWAGNTSTGDTWNVLNNSFVHSLVFTNKSGSTLTLNIKVVNNEVTVSICPLNLQLPAGESYVDESKVFTIGDIVQFTVNQSCDYHFSIEER